MKVNQISHSITYYLRFGCTTIGQATTRVVMLVNTLIFLQIHPVKNGRPAGDDTSQVPLSVVRG